MPRARPRDPRLVVARDRGQSRGDGSVWSQEPHPPGLVHVPQRSEGPGLRGQRGRQAMNTSRLRNFLLQLPKPALVRVTTGAGEVEELKPSKSWARMAETIAALDPQLVQCFSADGKLLRAADFSDESSRRSDAAEVPPGIAADPNALMLTHFANLLHRAYEHSTEVAFDRIVQVFNVMNERAEGIERRLERAEAERRRLLQEQVDDAMDRAQERAEAAEEQAANGAGGFEQAMASNFLSGMMGGGSAAAPAPAKPNGASNGKKS